MRVKRGKSETYCILICERWSEQNRKRFPLTTAKIKEEASQMPGTDDVAMVVRFNGVVSVRYITDHR